MPLRKLSALLLITSLAACSQDEPAQSPPKSYGAELGDSYKGMLDQARQGAGDLDQQMLRTEQAVRER